MRKLPISPALLAITVLQGVGAVLLFVSVLIITKALGPELYGRYAWVVAGGGILSLLIQHGLPTTIVKNFAPLDLKSREALPVAGTVLLIWACSALALVAAVLLHGVDLGFSHPETIWILPVGFGLASVAIADATLRAADEGVRANIASQLIRPGLLVGVALALTFLGLKEPVYYLVLYALAGLVGGIAFLGHLPAAAVRDLGQGRLTDQRWVKSNSAHFHVSVSRSISNFLPVFISGLILPLDQVAYLALALQLTSPLQFGLVASRAYYAAKINNRIKKNEAMAARPILRRAALFSQSVAILAAIGVAGLLFVLYLFGVGPIVDFANTNLLISILVAVGLGRLGYAAFGPVQLVAIMLHDEARVRTLTLLFTVCFAIGLTLAALTGNVLACGLVMPIYTFALTASLRQRVKLKFSEHGTGETT